MAGADNAGNFVMRENIAIGLAHQTNAIRRASPERRASRDAGVRLRLLKTHGEPHVIAHPIAYRRLPEKTGRS